MKLSYLWIAPEINPINGKARSIPVLNVWNIYGRVYFFSWFGFMVAFWAWYAFPPLITRIIKSDLHLTTAEIANSNIVSLVATLFVRNLAGPLCDQFGPRRVFASLLLAGSIPLGLAPLVQNANGLYASRFFIGILGGSFVPCLVWCTAFFDKNVVGSANALAGGWGNAGGGITYFIMPAVFNSLSARGYSNGESWRLTFLVPLVVVLVTSVAMLVFCPDTPTGKWSERHLHADENLASLGVSVPADPEHGIIEKKLSSASDENVPEFEKKKDEEKIPTTTSNSSHHHQPTDYHSDSELLGIAHGEIVQKPTVNGIFKIIVSPQTLFHLVTYFCSFGAELAIEAVLSAFYTAAFPGINPTRAANLAAIFGFLNFVTRPAGGFLSDYLYRTTRGGLWAKKIAVVVCGVISGVFLIIIGNTTKNTGGGNAMSATLTLTTLLAVFVEAGNGANFGLVPHVHPWANGVVSGTTGAAGNLGGVVFSIIFRFTGNSANYAQAFWVIGVITIMLNLALSWVPPVPRGQIGGR
ncbi:nitrate transporter [Xylariaceae sp. FL0255]|nr:nitrate transporter [Xylariaceae sp. FL0255]